MLLQHLEKTGGKLPYLKRVVIGGSACPRAMIKTFEEDYGVQVFHAWGMTEMSPLGTVGSLKPEYAGLTGEALLGHQAEAGLPAVRRRDENHRRCQQARCRGTARPSAASRCAGPPSPRPISRSTGKLSTSDGFFDTGDVATMDPLRLHADHRPLQGRDQVRRRVDFLDRSGKPRRRPPQSGGGGGDRRTPSEMGRAAAAHDRAQRGPDGNQGGDSRLLRGKIATWWMPDDVVFVEAIPHTATGKIQKTALRDNSRITCCRQRSRPSNYLRPFFRARSRLAV